jgi:hypothetical protein
MRMIRQDVAFPPFRFEQDAYFMPAVTDAVAGSVWCWQLHSVTSMWGPGVSMRAPG